MVKTNLKLLPTLDQALDLAKGIGQALLMTATPEQKAAGMEYIAVIKITDEVIGNYAISRKTANRLRCTHTITSRKFQKGSVCIYLDL
jgi:hypothetical protein